VKAQETQLQSQSHDAKPAPNVGAQVVAIPVRIAGEQELVAGLIERRATAVQALYSQYSSTVRRVLTQALGSDRDVEDLTQDTLIKVVERASALRKAESLRCFVIGVAIRLAKNEIRRRAIRRFVGLEEVAEIPLVAPHDAVTTQGARHLYRALDRLELTGRMAFVLRYVHGCDLAETASACACSIATVKRKLSRAEARFAALVEGDPVLREFLERRGGPS
jgi:RNA polymerase sigma-70 factor (ECF subfamily)